MLRDYQENAITALGEYWSKSSRPCILQLATGAGKSHIIAELINRSNVPVLVLQPTKEILEQNYEKLANTGFDTRKMSICSASAGSHEINRYVTFATIGTLMSARLREHWLRNLQHIGLIIVDEVDVVPTERATSQYIQFFAAMPEKCRIVGLTATPWRNVIYQQMYCDPKVYCRPMTRIACKGGKKTRFGTWVWNKVVYRCGIADLQKRGYLSPTKYYIAETDWSFVRDVPGRVDYDTTEMMKWIDIEDNTSRFTQAVAWCLKNNMKSIVFSPNIDMNFRLKRVIEKLGGKAECMDSDNDNRASRQRKMDEFRAGKFQFLVNVGMVGRGVDVPSVDAVILCRPTKSLSLYMQFVGRCLRIDPDKPNKTAYILDLSGNVERFGHVEDVILHPMEMTTDWGYKYTKETIVIKPEGKRPKIFDRVS